MTRRPLAIIGDGEHAQVIVDAARSRADEWVVMGCTGLDARSRGRVGGREPLVWLGDDRTAIAWMAGLDGPERPWLVLGIGLARDPSEREAIVERYATWDQWATIVHAGAIVSPSATLAPGAVVLAGAVVGPWAQIGAHVVVNSAAILEHDVVVDPYAMVGPGAIVGGGANIGRGALIGLGASVRDHRSIGARSVVGMGSVVVADVAPDSRVAGTPARPMDAIDD